MQLGMIGLGRMGANMVRRLMAGGHGCVAFDRNPDNVARLTAEGASGCGSLQEFIGKLAKPRVAWIMVPAGEITEQTIEALARIMESGDIIVDGGNTYYKDDVRRARALAARGIHYVDVGTSGGVWGRERGYCLMIGGERDVAAHLDPVFRTLAPGSATAPPTPGRHNRSGTAEQGYLYCGPAGAGHFVKMIHNGIEYGLMQAYAEGFDILRNAGKPELAADLRYDLDLGEIAELWRRGSVVGSWLLDLTASALAEDPGLSTYIGSVPDSGEGRWTIQAAVEQATSAPVLSAALYARFRSREDHTFGEKLLSAMRRQFGGHAEKAP
ncbi:MAG: decarboxylating 6-phosphogluconate dehydrogenase [Gammaproteobacteria bacterium]|nr:decarboxylating 6-phosphogluconate dehydrogenase [Gammaproteobacteria bacterium]